MAWTFNRLTTAKVENGREKSRFNPVSIPFPSICFSIFVPYFGLYRNGTGKSGKRDGKRDGCIREQDGKREKGYPARICGIPFFDRDIPFLTNTG